MSTACLDSAGLAIGRDSPGDDSKMSDMSNDGALASADDSALFDDVISGAASDEPVEQVGQVEDKQPETPAQTQTEQPATAREDAANVPSWRLREERERAQSAERRNQELTRQLEALQARQPKADQQVPDIFENPNQFVEQATKQQLDPVRGEIGQLREYYSRERAFDKHGQEKVQAAYQALEKGMASRDPEAWTAYNRAMQSMDPYGSIMDWHKQRETIAQIGGDLDSYKQRLLDEALKDPEYQKKVLEAARGQAQQSGSAVARPAVSSLPSINRVGSAALHNSQQDVSDAELFDATTRRKRA